MPTSSPPVEGLTRRWTVRTDLRDPEVEIRLAAAVQAEPIVARFLASRGYTEPGSALAYASPTLTALHEPSLMPGMDKAATRLLDAIRSGEQIAIYGDYDVDGITATSILYHAIRAIEPNANLRPYIPHRLDEGYGLNSAAIRRLRDEGAGLVVSVDCGITAFEPARAARDLGLDLIITDHHNIAGEDEGADSELPPAYAVVHPRIRVQGECPYPFGELCGAGVAFKLAWRVATLASGSDRVSPEVRAVLLDLLALAALGTIADIVPLVDENRVIASFGLKHIRSTKLTGLRALLAASDLLDESIDAEKVGFILGPRLNACGRMGHAAEAVEMLTVASERRAAEIAEQLNEQNKQRQATERKIFEQACELAEQGGMTGEDGRRAIVLAHEQWHPGVVGIVCSRIVQRYHRPAILMQIEKDESGHVTCKGSARSIDGYNLHAGLSACCDLLDTFGGHDMAAGLSLNGLNLNRFREALCEHADGLISDEMMVPSLTIDCEAALNEFSPTAIERLLALGPFGRANPSPRLLLRGVAVADEPRVMGSNGRHLSFFVGDPNAPKTRQIRVVGWSWAAHKQNIRRGDRIDLVVSPKINRWKGRVSVEPELQDLRPAGSG
ncbi:MAG: single-stranded-DNA-specific exonuclease RecJ [Phycisphaerales bacterium JB065]